MKKLVLLFVVLSACTSGTVSRHEAALEISEAACERGLFCGTLGNESESDCASYDFTSLCDQYPGCTGDVSEKSLDACLSAISDLPCSSMYLPVDCYSVLTP